MIVDARLGFAKRSWRRTVEVYDSRALGRSAWVRKLRMSRETIRLVMSVLKLAFTAFKSAYRTRVSTCPINCGDNLTGRTWALIIRVEQRSVVNKLTRNKVTVTTFAANITKK